MPKTAVFLGAGASKAFGYPMVEKILPLIVAGIKKNKLFKTVDKDTRQIYTNLVKQLLVNLSPGMRAGIQKNEPSKDWPLVTVLLSLAGHISSSQQDIVDWNHDLRSFDLEEDSTLSQRLQLSDLVTLLDVAIIDVIVQSGQVKNNVMDRFIQWVKACNEPKDKIKRIPSKDFVSVITTNYDCSFEWNALEDGEAENADELIDYGLNWRDIKTGEVYLRPSLPRFKVFKLHGSVDWLRCPRCGFLYINPTYDISHIPLSNHKNNATECHCGYWPLQPVLFTPSYVREYRDVNVLQVWRNALEELRAADRWIIAGYSLPTEDFAIRSLFLRALYGRNKSPQIIVIQKGNGSNSRYEQFFGKGLVKNYFSKGMEAYPFPVKNARHHITNMRKTK